MKHGKHFQQAVQVNQDVRWKVKTQKENPKELNV